jgi:hypothetical protein
MQEARVHLGCAKLEPACARTAAEQSIFESCLHAAQEPATHGYGKESLLDRVDLAKYSVTASSGPYDVRGFSCLEKTKEVFSMVYPSRR